MDRSIERDYEPGGPGREAFDNPEGADWHQPIDQRFYDRGPRYDQAGYRRTQGTDLSYEEKYRPGPDSALNRPRSRRGEGGPDRGDALGRHERPEDVYARRMAPGRYAGTNTYDGGSEAQPDDRAGRVYGGDASGDPMRGGPHAGRGPKGYRRSDDRIKEEVCQVLCDHGWIDASDIEVRVEGGEVTLDGSVDSREAKRLADEVAGTVRGVVDVHNHLRLRGPGAGTRAAESKPTTAW